MSLNKVFIGRALTIFLLNMICLHSTHKIDANATGVYRALVKFFSNQSNDSLGLLDKKQDVYSITSSKMQLNIHDLNADVYDEDSTFAFKNYRGMTVRHFTGVKLESKDQISKRDELLKYLRTRWRGARI